MATGGACDGFPVGAADSHVVTAAFDATAGAVRWSAVWDGRPDATDNGNDVAFSPDGSKVFIGGITTGATNGDLNYLTLAYGVRRGKQLWARVYSGLNTGGSERAIRPGRFAERRQGVRHGGERRCPRVRHRLRDCRLRSAQRQAAESPARIAAAPIERGRSRLTQAMSSSVAYLVASTHPTVPYTALDEQEVLALRTADGSTAWSTRLDAGADNALTGEAVAVSPDGSSVVTLGQITRSADLLGPRDQNIYDSLVAAFVS